IAAELRTLLLAWKASDEAHRAAEEKRTQDTGGTLTAEDKKPLALRLVAPSTLGTPMDANNLAHRVVALGKRIGVAVSPHTLRRTFATLLWDRRVSIERISVFLGHSSLAVTEKWYADMKVDGDDSDVSRL